MEDIARHRVPIIESAIKVIPEIISAVSDISIHKKKSQLYKIVKDLHPEYTDLTFIRARDIEDAQEMYEKLLSKGYPVLMYDSSGVMLYH